MPAKKPVKMRTKTRRTPLGGRVVSFPQVQGKTIATVEFSTIDDENSITLKFQDKTSLSFDYRPEASFSFSILADYADWKTGNWRPLKRWPNIRSASPNA
jgi:hypothetical protein